MLWAVGLATAVVTGLMTTLLTGSAEDIVHTVLEPEPPTITRTDVRVMQLRRPDGTLAAGYRIEGRSSGECEAGSLSSDPLTLVCFADDSVKYGSCWPDPRHDSADCVISPWDKGIRVVQDSDPDRSGAQYISDDLPPWALEIRDPRHPGATLRCQSLAGATFVIDGKRANWECASEEGKPVGHALGQLEQRTTRPWSVSFWPAGDSEVRNAVVATVWK